MYTIELEDVQGYVLREYRNMKFSRFVLLNVTDAQRAKSWINSICDELTNAVKVNKDELPDTALNIAFAKDGLLNLGLDKANLESFSPPFKEGMVTPHRQRLLGDIKDSDPETWEWGNPEKNPAQIILMVFGKDETTCMEYYNRLRRGYEASGLEESRNLDGVTLKDNKEHFGFRDGISQPTVLGSGRTGPEFNYVNPGEFILGYENNYFVFPDSPTIVKEQGQSSLLPPSGARPGHRDLGKNGTYLIIRQMKEDVDAFWTFMKDRTKENGQVNEEASIKLASQMFGRWPSGAPLSKFPDKDPGGASDDNDFLYYKDDRDGLKCPFGSHIRRMNPRDNFEEKDTPGKSQILSNRHRLIRRARLYGEPIISSPTNHKPEGEVGLYFTCFAADISRQFEFLQYTWSNYPKIKQLYFDPDPIIGVVKEPEVRSLGYGEDERKEKQVQQFTIQAEPHNKSIKDLQRFIEIRGGAYFFFPSITSIRYLCTI